MHENRIVLRVVKVTHPRLSRGPAKLLMLGFNTIYVKLQGGLQKNIGVNTYDFQKTMTCLNPVRWSPLFPDNVLSKHRIYT